MTRGVIVVEEPDGAWTAEIERALAERQFHVARVRELAHVPYLLLSGGVCALVLGGRRLGKREALLLERCRKARPHLRVVVVAASGSQGDLKRALEGGATTFLVWPATPDVVVEAVSPKGDHEHG